MRLTRKEAIFLLLVATMGCPSSPAPVESSQTTTASASAAASASVATPPSASPWADAGAPCAPCASSAAPPDDSHDNPWCAPVKTMGYGTWKPKPEEVITALGALKGSGGRGGWLASMVGDCMQRIGHPYVEVMSGVMSGERGTPMANTFAVGSVEWKGRKFITLTNTARMHATFVSTVDAVELTPKGAVQVIETCQDDPKSTIGPSGPRVAPPKGWSTFPEEVRKQLCP